MTETNSLSGQFERVSERLHDVADVLAGTGQGFALTYVTAAITSLRLAHAAIVSATRDDPENADADHAQVWRLSFADGQPTCVFLQPHGQVHVRAVRVGSSYKSEPSADTDLPIGKAVDLGADILSSPAARSFATGGIGAALLADALGTRSWKHPDSPHPWSVTRVAARSIVMALTAGREVRSLADHLTGAVLDREVLALIESLGWRRHVGDLDVGRHPG